MSFSRAVALNWVSRGFINKLRGLQDGSPSRGSVAVKLALFSQSLNFSFRCNVVRQPSYPGLHFCFSLTPDNIRCSYRGRWEGMGSRGQARRLSQLV